MQTRYLHVVIFTLSLNAVLSKLMDNPITLLHFTATRSKDEAQPGIFCSELVSYYPLKVCLVCLFPLAVLERESRKIYVDGLQMRRLFSEKG
jgi:hypothetical protein